MSPKSAGGKNKDLHLLCLYALLGLPVHLPGLSQCYARSSLWSWSSSSSSSPPLQPPAMISMERTMNTSGGGGRSSETTTRTTTTTTTATSSTTGHRSHTNQDEQWISFSGLQEAMRPEWLDAHRWWSPSPSSSSSWMLLFVSESCSIGRLSNLPVVSALTSAERTCNEPTMLADNNNNNRPIFSIWN